MLLLPVLLPALREPSQSFPALIVSTPQRYNRAAEQVTLAGFSPVSRAPPVFANHSECAGISRGEYGLTLAMRSALQRVAASDSPTAVFEDDVVLATSSDAVLDYARDSLRSALIESKAQVDHV